MRGQMRPMTVIDLQLASNNITGLFSQSSLLTCLIFLLIKYCCTLHFLNLGDVPPNFWIWGDGKFFFVPPPNCGTGLRHCLPCTYCILCSVLYIMFRVHICLCIDCHCNDCLLPAWRINFFITCLFGLAWPLLVIGPCDAADIVQPAVRLAGVGCILYSINYDATVRLVSRQSSPTLVETLESRPLTTEVNYTGACESGATEECRLFLECLQEGFITQHVTNLSLIHISEPTRPY